MNVYLEDNFSLLLLGGGELVYYLNKHAGRKFLKLKYVETTFWDAKKLAKVNYSRDNM